MTDKVKKKRSKRFLVVTVFLIILSVFVYVSIRGEYLQMLEIGEKYTEVFFQNLKFSGYTYITNFIILFVLIYITNKIIKKALKPFFLDEQRETPKLPNKSIALVFAGIVSILFSPIIIEKIIFILNNTKFGINDPVFNLDISYYMFQKPFVELIIFYFIYIIIGLTAYSIAYYITVFNVFFDGIDLEILKKSLILKQIITNVFSVTVFVAALILIKTQNIIFGNLMYLNSKEIHLQGADFLDVNIKLWAYRLLSIIVVISVFFMIKNIKRKNIKKAIISVLVVPAYLITLILVMIGVDLVFINNNDFDRQKQYIKYNIDNTKKAYNIEIEEKTIKETGIITKDEILNNQEILTNIPIVSSNNVLEVINKYKNDLGYYSYRNINAGKYNISGIESFVYITPREIKANATSFLGNTYEYTHGYSTIITDATETNENGNIKYIQEEINGNEVIKITEPRIYYGLETNQTIITNVKTKKEYDYPITSIKNAETVYNGKSGLSLNFLDRLVLALKKLDFNLFLSLEIKENSKILPNRNIIARAKKIMPYLVYDENPYMVIDDKGKLNWVLDAYTISKNYPYSTETLVQINGEKQKINYIRNSVKVIINAYDGDIKFYIVDRNDPIIIAYDKAYPNLFEKLESKIPEDINKHIVYSKFLYDIQAEMLTMYHNIQPDVLYRNDDIWEIAKYSLKTNTTKQTKFNSYYSFVKDNDTANLGLILPYSYINRKNINAYLIGTYEKNNQKLVLYKFLDNINNISPTTLETQIEENKMISQELSSLNITGTKLIKDMIIIPIENKLLYIQPVYQIYLNDDNIPVLKKVIVSSGNKVAIGNNLEEAIDNLSSQYAVNIEFENTENQEELLKSIIKANKNLDESNNSNDWELIGKDMKKLQELITELENMQKIEEEKNLDSQNNILEN